MGEREEENREGRGEGREREEQRGEREEENREGGGEGGEGGRE